MTKQELPAYDVVEESVDDGKTHYALTDGYEVADWRPGPPGSGPTTEVHVIIPVRARMKVVMRLKSARALDELVGVLLEYRNHVWPGVPQ